MFVHCDALNDYRIYRDRPGFYGAGWIFATLDRSTWNESPESLGDYQGTTDVVEWRRPALYEFQSYGTCDSPGQFQRTRLYEWLERSERKFIVTFTLITKPDDGCFRFRKNGPYLGEKNLRGHEYLKDEPEIDEVYVFNIIEMR